jgi:uncharacterized coiled-coil protein SlyX
MVDNDAAIRFVNDRIAAQKDKVARMRAQVDGLLRSIEDAEAEIAALEGAD